MSRTVAAALILHAVQLLDQMGFKDHAQLGVLINADEEQGSPASGAFGAHANDNEHVLIPWIAPRLYLATRMVMEVGSGAVRW